MKLQACPKALFQGERLQPLEQIVQPSITASAAMGHGDAVFFIKSGNIATSRIHNTSRPEFQRQAVLGVTMFKQLRQVSACVLWRRATTFALHQPQGLLVSCSLSSSIACSHFSLILRPPSATIPYVRGQAESQVISPEIPQFIPLVQIAHRTLDRYPRYRQRYVAAGESTSAAC